MGEEKNLPKKSNNFKETPAGTEDNAGIEFTEKEIETLKNTVARDANEHEFKMFISLARRYGLDPFNKEIFFFKVNGKPQIITSRDGYLKIADRHPEYDGLVSDVVKENDKFRRRIDGIDHEYGTQRGDIIGAYALVYRKDRKYPVYVFAPFNEYDANTRVWRQYPSAMILKCAESMALKRAFTVSGLVSREEMKIVHIQEEEENKNSNNSTLPEVEHHELPEEEIKDDTDGNNNQNEDEYDTANNISSKTSTDREGKESYSQREREIKELVGNNKELKEELMNYLSYIKEEEKLETVSLADLSEDQYSELKSILEQIKGMINKGA